MNTSITELSVLESILRLLVACVLGGVIGFEREKSHRPAGLRTHLIVCMGSCLAMITSLNIFHMFYTVSNADPARLSQGVISGIGFLGAGTIIREGNKIKGLTTAASIWGVACIGLSIGVGLYTIGIISVVLLMIILIWVNSLESRFVQYVVVFQLSLRVRKESGSLEILYHIVDKYKSSVKSIDVTTEKENDDMIRCIVKSPSERQRQNILQELLENKSIKKLNSTEVNNEKFI